MEASVLSVFIGVYLRLKIACSDFFSILQMVKHLPNLLTFARLALAPYLFLLLWRREYRPVLALFLIVAITDALDGWIARTFDAASRLGAYLDPVADKILLSGIFLMLALSGAIEVWLAVLVLGRDLLILLAALWLYLVKTLRSFPPSPWGKASTFAQIAFVVAVVTHLAGFVSVQVALPFEWATVAFTVWSGVDYARRAVSLAQQGHRQTK